MGRAKIINFVKNNPLIFFIVPLLLLTRSHSYLFFHTTAEFFTMLIALSTFFFAWHTKEFSKNNFFIFLGIVLLFVGLIDLMHTLSYKGMNIFQGLNSNTPTQLWIAQRYILSSSLVVSLIFIKRKLRYYTALFFYSILTGLVLFSVFIWKNFPDSYIDSYGLTNFKIFSEYIISFLFLYAGYLLWTHRNKFDPTVYRLLVISFILQAIAELLFTLYIDVYGIFNMIGHVVELIAYYSMYKAIIEIGLTKPYKLLFLEMQEADIKKDEFLRIASHELKTPLTSIKLYSEVLLRHLQLNPEDKKLLEGIDTTSDKATKLINELLDVSKIDSGKLTVDLEPLCFQDLVYDVVQDLKPSLEVRKIVLDVKGKTIIKGDKERLWQVIVNLINNAAKYSNSDCEILVKVTSDDKKITFSVKDNGVGIPNEYLERVFEKYYRGNFENSKKQGLGLGLFISKQIITSHKGKIWVESEEGNGSTFSFYLPVE